jgi:hypothetical protein
LLILALAITAPAQNDLPRMDVLMCVRDNGFAKKLLRSSTLLVPSTSPELAAAV